MPSWLGFDTDHLMYAPVVFITNDFGVDAGGRGLLNDIGG